MGSEYDTVIVGGSLAGCTAAILLGRAGARVALLEQRPDPAAYKRICSHFIQSSAVPTLERLGLLEPIEQMGGVRSRLQVWTSAGWTRMASDSLPPAVNIRRERLDPLIRRTAGETPGVDLVLGERVDRLISEGGQFCGVETVSPSGDRRELRARLVIGADGRDSRVAPLAGVRTRTRPHGRFAYGAYFEGPPAAADPSDAVMWILDPEWAAAFPTDSGLTFYACMPTKGHLTEFKRDPEQALVDALRALPDPPPIDASERVSPVTGKIDMTNVMRGPVAPGLALVGDAALATDPLWGVGCGWALQSAEWLSDAVAPVLAGAPAGAGPEPLTKALNLYRRQFRRRLGAHAFMIHDYATGRKLQPQERLLWATSTRDRRLAELFEAYGTRNMHPAEFLARAVPRAVVVNAARALAGRRPAGAPAPARPAA